MFDINLEDFYPLLWENKCTNDMEDCCFILRPELDGEKDQIIDVHRHSYSEVISRQFKLSEELSCQHKKSMTRKLGIQIEACMECDFTLTDTRKPKMFANTPFQVKTRTIYHEMLKYQQEIWMDGPDYPAHWMVSSNLGNSEHIDNSQSYAVWLTSTFDDFTPTSRRFLLPKWKAYRTSYGGQTTKTTHSTPHSA